MNARHREAAGSKRGRRLVWGRRHEREFVMKISMSLVAMIVLSVLCLPANAAKANTGHKKLTPEQFANLPPDQQAAIRICRTRMRAAGNGPNPAFMQSCLKNPGNLKANNGGRGFASPKRKALMKAHRYQARLRYQRLHGVPQ
jgi:hypothetical protein